MGVPTKFIIHTRTEENKNRFYGMDNWVIKAKEMWLGQASDLEVTVKDLHNGKYECTYTAGENAAGDSELKVTLDCVYVEDEKE